MNNVPRFRRCAIFRIRQTVSLKIIVFSMCDIPNSSYSANGITVFSMETPCWSPFEGLQHGGRPAGNQWKHLEFSMPLSKRSFSLLNFKTFA